MSLIKPKFAQAENALRVSVKQNAFSLFLKVLGDSLLTAGHVQRYNRLLRRVRNCRFITIIFIIIISLRYVAVLKYGELFITHREDHACH